MSAVRIFSASPFCASHAFGGSSLSKCSLYPLSARDKVSASSYGPWLKVAFDISNRPHGKPLQNFPQGSGGILTLTFLVLSVGLWHVLSYIHKLAAYISACFWMYINPRPNSRNHRISLRYINFTYPHFPFLYDKPNRASSQLCLLRQGLWTW